MSFRLLFVGVALASLFSFPAFGQTLPRWGLQCTDANTHVAEFVDYPPVSSLPKIQASESESIDQIAAKYFDAISKADLNGGTSSSALASVYLQLKNGAHLVPKNSSFVVTYKGKELSDPVDESLTAPIRCSCEAISATSGNGYAYVSERFFRSTRISNLIKAQVLVDLTLSQAAQTSWRERSDPIRAQRTPIETEISRLEKIEADESLDADTRGKAHRARLEAEAKLNLQPIPERFAFDLEPPAIRDKDCKALSARNPKQANDWKDFSEKRAKGEWSAEFALPSLGGSNIQAPGATPPSDGAL